jgi:hypothetical protein
MSILSNIRIAVGDFFSKPKAFAEARGLTAKLAVTVYTSILVVALIALAFIATPFVFIEATIRGFVSAALAGYRDTAAIASNIANAVKTHAVMVKVLFSK